MTYHRRQHGPDFIEDLSLFRFLVENIHLLARPQRTEATQVHERAKVKILLRMHCRDVDVVMDQLLRMVAMQVRMVMTGQCCAHYSGRIQLSVDDSSQSSH